MKTLGADTTAIQELSVAPSSNCFANIVAVSSLYCVPLNGLKGLGRFWRTRASYPELAHVPVLPEGCHGQRGILTGTVFYNLQTLQSLFLKIALRIELRQSFQGLTGEETGQVCNVNTHDIGSCMLLTHGLSSSSSSSSPPPPLWRSAIELDRCMFQICSTQATTTWIRYSLDKMTPISQIVSWMCSTRANDCRWAKVLAPSLLGFPIRYLVPRLVRCARNCLRGAGLLFSLTPSMSKIAHLRMAEA